MIDLNQHFTVTIVGSKKRLNLISQLDKFKSTFPQLKEEIEALIKSIGQTHIS